MWEIVRQVRERKMEIELPHPTAGGGTVRLIGNPIKMSETPVTYRRPPPTVGQHSDEVLKELLDMGEDEIADLRARKVL